MFEVSFLQAMLGGVLIGLSASLLLIFNGRIAGISGIFFGVIKPLQHETLWRFLFLLGLLTGGAMVALKNIHAFDNLTGASLPLLMMAGLLVGFGARLGSGCTSGHGVCGISRFSRRSLLATFVFMATGAFTVFFVHHILG